MGHVVYGYVPKLRIKYSKCILYLYSNNTYFNINKYNYVKKILDKFYLIMYLRVEDEFQLGITNIIRFYAVRK